MLCSGASSSVCCFGCWVASCAWHTFSRDDRLGDFLTQDPPTSRRMINSIWPESSYLFYNFLFTLLFRSPEYLTRTMALKYSVQPWSEWTDDVLTTKNQCEQHQFESFREGFCFFGVLFVCLDQLGGCRSQQWYWSSMETVCLNRRDVCVKLRPQSDEMKSSFQLQHIKHR